MGRDEGGSEAREGAKEIWVTTAAATASELKGGGWKESSFHDWICEGASLKA